MGGVGMMADKDGGRWGCLGGARGAAYLLGVMYSGSTGRKFREVVKVSKCVGWEGVAACWAICSDIAKGNTSS